MPEHGTIGIEFVKAFGFAEYENVMEARIANLNGALAVSNKWAQRGAERIHALRKEISEMRLRLEEAKTTEG